MVAGTALKHPSRSLRSSQPNNDDPSTLPLRSKRIRTYTLQDSVQDKKRRKLLDNHIPPLRIPLRSKAGNPQSISLPEVDIPPKGLDSPTPKAQYDQYQRIEEEARAAIRRLGSPAISQDERRKLRSEHGGSRSKTELSQYFPNFEDMLSLEPPDPEALSSRSRLVLVDDLPNYTAPPARLDPFGSEKSLHNTSVVNISLPRLSKATRLIDPLQNDTYLKIHRKAERHEKQMKNGDRERAQHEKYQLERLLEDLRGPDWLKTLGISGITETEKKRYEPKRLLFIRETQALIDKFKWWKEEEKRRKVEREQALLAEETDGQKGEVNDLDGFDNEERSSTSSPAPNSSELDALASQQLLEEAKSASKRKRGSPQQIAQLPQAPPPPVHRPFTSFFSKPHLRDAAISGRQRGRTVLAFGHAVPEVEDVDFELPDDVLTEDAIKASQRSRRRRKRDTDD